MCKSYIEFNFLECFSWAWDRSSISAFYFKETTMCNVPKSVKKYDWIHNAKKCYYPFSLFHWDSSTSSSFKAQNEKQWAKIRKMTRHNFTLYSYIKNSFQVSTLLCWSNIETANIEIE